MDIALRIAEIQGEGEGSEYFKHFTFIVHSNKWECDLKEAGVEPVGVGKMRVGKDGLQRFRRNSVWQRSGDTDTRTKLRLQFSHRFDEPLGPRRRCIIGVHFYGVPRAKNIKYLQQQ